MLLYNGKMAQSHMNHLTSSVTMPLKFVQTMNRNMIYLMNPDGNSSVVMPNQKITSTYDLWCQNKILPKQCAIP